MSGPNTRPIRNDRLTGEPSHQPRDYSASQQNEPQGGEPFHVSSKQSGRLRRAFLAIVPSPFRPLASILSLCFWCLAVTFLYGAGAVEWRWVSVPVFTPHTASADDIRKITARVDALEHDSAMSLRIQQRIRMTGLQEALCRGYDRNLRLELDELMQDYRERNGQWYVLPPCEASKP